MRSAPLSTLSLLVAASSGGCASSGSAEPSDPREVQRVEHAIDLSGEWNDVDSDLVASAMIGDCLGAPWLESWRSAKAGTKPVVRLYPVRNRTVAYIDYRYFTKQIEAALVRSGKIDVLASLEELEDDEGEVTGLAAAEESADFVMTGVIVSQEDRVEKEEVVAYLTSIELLEVETNKKAWMGQKRIRKLIKR